MAACCSMLQRSCSASVAHALMYPTLATPAHLPTPPAVQLAGAASAGSCRCRCVAKYGWTTARRQRCRWESHAAGWGRLGAGRPKRRAPPAKPASAWCCCAVVGPRRRLTGWDPSPLAAFSPLPGLTTTALCQHVPLAGLTITAPPPMRAAPTRTARRACSRRALSRWRASLRRRCGPGGCGWRMGPPQPAQALPLPRRSPVAGAHFALQ